MIESEDPTSDPEDSGSLGAEFGEEAEVEPNLPNGLARMETGYMEYKKTWSPRADMRYLWRRHTQRCIDLQVLCRITAPG